MCAQIVHRGPDDEGIFVDGALGLAMRRLSIIDVEAGRQPIFNENGDVSVVFNGEIYNFLELRDELAAKGHQFRTRSDTEVLVHLYEEVGVDFVKRLNGMFSVALWDRRQRRLVLARDRLGQKPLYYCQTDDGLVFGSELKCLLQCDEIPRNVNPEAVYHYFTLGYIPNPLTIYQDIRQLPPAHRLVVDGKGVREERYWTLSPQIDKSLDYDDTCQHLQELLSDAVTRRMISDVPLGAFLSGGLDSSIIVALMAEQSSRPVQTFHIDFAEPKYSERKYARAVAERYSTDHHELVVNPSALEVLDEIVAMFDEPFGDSSAVPTYYVSKLTREYVTVALAGDGGDESFGGYDRYLRILQRRQLPPPIRKGLGVAGELVHRMLPRAAPGRRYFRSLGQSHFLHFAVGTDEWETAEFLDPEFLATMSPVSTFEFVAGHMEQANGGDRLAPYSFLDLHHYLPDDILVKVDRMSMAHSLELRAPFLDFRLVELAARLPFDWKVRNGATKAILKDAFSDRLPAEVAVQRKQGFSLPMDEWLRGELRPLLEDAIDDSAVRAAGIFNMREIRLLADEHLSARRERSDLLWRYLFFVRWWHNCYLANSRQARCSAEAQS